ncbi:MAG: PilZ domain-containing protein [Betaproteobacteria bacterium]|nr:PilZ domain-containing protein [Betaproteobacteria bacterium]
MSELQGSIAPRPGVLSLSIKEKSALYAAYMPYLKGGGIFIPTAKPYQLGDEVFMLLSLMGDPNKLPVAGRVVWITPEGAQGNKVQGVGVQFSDNESGITVRNKIEALLGGSKASRPTHTM